MEEKEGRSRDFGVKFAEALKEKAVEAASEHNLDARYIMLGAAEYLRKDAEFGLNPPLDSSRTDPEERAN